MHKVYVLHRNYPYEFGEVLGVYSTLDAATKAAENALKERDYADLEVTEWTCQDGQTEYVAASEAVWSYECK